MVSNLITRAALACGLAGSIAAAATVVALAVPCRAPLASDACRAETGREVGGLMVALAHASVAGLMLGAAGVACVARRPA